MSQAKVLTERELQRVLDYVSRSKHARRNRTIFLLQHWAGMRVGECAAVRYADVLNIDGTIKAEIKLSRHQTKGDQSRTVVLS